MALTRKALKAMGLTDEQVDSIIEMHTETVDGLKVQVNTYKADADKLPGVLKELDALKEAGDSGYKEKYEAEKKAHDKLKTDIASEKSRAAKESAVRAYYESKGITGKSLDIAMRGSGAEIAALELDGGKIKDAAALEALVKGDFAGLVSTTTVEGAQTANPPVNNGGGKAAFDAMSLSEKMKYANGHPREAAEWLK